MSANTNQTVGGAILKMILTGVVDASMTTFFQNAASPATDVYVSLHTADPTSTGNQLSSEVAYTSYARATVARTTGGWTVTTNAVSPTASIPFPTCGASGAVATFWAIGTASSGAGQILWSGSLASTTIATGNTPSISTSSTLTIN